MITLALPDSINRLTGGSIYDKEVSKRLSCAVLELPKSFPFPSLKDLEATKKALDLAKSPLLIDGLAFGAFNEDILQSLPKNTFCLLHHPLFLEAGLSEENALRLKLSEKFALNFAKGVVVTSFATKQAVHESFNYPLENICVAEPGVTVRPKGEGRGVKLLAVGTVSPRKNHIALLRALSKINADWRLEIVGSLTTYPSTSNELQHFIVDNALSDKVILLGEQGQEGLNAAYKRASMFVLPSLYEGYGMVLTEAISAGLAVLTTACAAAETLPLDSCIIVPPNDDAALEAALRRLFSDENLCKTLKINALKAVKQFNRWEDTARIIAKFIGENS